MKMEQRIEEEETGKEAESVREAHWHFKVCKSLR